MGPGSCSICSVFLGSSKKTNMTKIAELLQSLLVEVNSKLLEELIICETCLTKLQSAYNFKASYLENSQKLCIKQEDFEDEVVCEMCKDNVNSIDCIPLFFSLTDIDKLNLFKCLSSELKYQDSPQTCQLCQKSVLNFCAVIKSLSVFVQDADANKTVAVNVLKSNELNSGQDIIVNSVNSADDLTIGVKQKDTEVNEEQEFTITYEDSLCKNEKLDLKSEEEPVNVQQQPLSPTAHPCHSGSVATLTSINQQDRIGQEIGQWQHRGQYASKYKCVKCEYVRDINCHGALGRLLVKILQGDILFRRDSKQQLFIKEINPKLLPATIYSIVRHYYGKKLNTKGLNQRHGAFMLLFGRHSHIYKLPVDRQNSIEIEIIGNECIKVPKSVMPSMSLPLSSLPSTSSSHIPPVQVPTHQASSMLIEAPTSSLFLFCVSQQNIHNTCN